MLNSAKHEIYCWHLNIYEQNDWLWGVKPEISIDFGYFNNYEQDKGLGSIRPIFGLTISEFMFVYL